MIRAAIIGTGKAAGMHAQALLNIPELRLVSVCSRHEDKARNFAANYNAKAYTELERMVEEQKIEMVIVCTPHPDHKNSATLAMRAGANVLVEKPLASCLEDCDEMISVAKSCGKKLGMVSQRRFLAPSMRVKKAINEGKLGRPMLGSVVMLGWRDKAYYESDPWRGSWGGEGGGVLVNQAPHQIDLLQWFMDDEIKDLYGVWQNINHPYIEVEDSATAIIRFKNGGVANLIVSNSQKPGIFGKVHIHGSNGASAGVQTDAGAMFLPGVSGATAPSLNDIWTIPGEEHLPTIWEKEDSQFFSTIDPIEYYIRLQNLDFVNAILNDKEPMIPAIEGRKTVEIFTAIYKSMRTGERVTWPV